MDMLNSKLSEHHSKVAYIATQIAKTLGMSNYDGYSDEVGRLFRRKSAGHSDEVGHPLRGCAAG